MILRAGDAKLRALPGVRAVGLIQMLPVQGWGCNSEHIHIIGTPPLQNPWTDPAEIRFVTPGYYEVFEDRLVAGRLQDPHLDRPTTRLVAVVNEVVVRKFIPAGRDPVGLQIGDERAGVAIGLFSPIALNESCRTQSG